MMPTGMVTVFGGSGFIGRHLIRRLARSASSVRAAVRHPDRALFLKTMGDVGCVTPVAVNARDDASVAAAVAGADAVVNLVGILFERGRQTFSAVHEEAAGRIAHAAKDSGVRRLVHVSALGASTASEAAYARSKAAGEAAVKEAFPEATVIRPSIVFGPEDDFFNRLAAFARLLPALPLIGGGHTRFQPVFVGDVADAIQRILEATASQDNMPGKIYELGGPRIYSFRDLMTLMLTEIGRNRLLVPIPFAVAEFEAFFLEKLPNPPLTRDQVALLRHDSVVSDGALGLSDLGITATAAEIVLPSYLGRYRRGGAK